MRYRIYFLLFLLPCLFLFPKDLFAEGSKEIYVTTYNTWLFMCSDNIGHCNNGGNRTPFAVYGCADQDRLYFTTVSNSETVFMGFHGTVDGQGVNPPPPSTAWIYMEVRNSSGTIVYPERKLPKSGTGYIANINAARVGPGQIYGAGGYTAMDFHPSAPDQFYVEFAVRDTLTNNLVGSGINIDLIDITVQDTVAQVVKPGRLFSKSWQFYENGQHCSAKTYIYSNDSIITSCGTNNMIGGIWVQFCNQWGCANTGNWLVDRKSRNSQSLLPQYKIFLNNPDNGLYPPATTLGQIVPPQPYGVQDCNTGHIDYYVNVDKPGSVEIDLTFPPPYITRILNQVVTPGQNTITWDGVDGTLPTGVSVPNGVNVTFTVKYINGLTNLPFYDIEGNPSGFTVSLVNPPGSQPLVYWDDTALGGTWGSNLTGCSSPPGCHTWPNPIGDSKTVNTWWYNVSATTAPMSLIQFRHSGALTFVQSPPSLCAGVSGQLFSVNQDPNTTVYHWSYTGTGATVHQTNPSDNFVTVDFAVNATSGQLQVYGTNGNCLAPGPTTSLNVTIKPVPVLNPPSPLVICSNVATNIILTSVPPSTTFSWTNPAPTCSPNITTCPAGLNGTNLINDILNLNNSITGTVVYHIISSLNGCNSSPQDFTLTVLPSPVPVIVGSDSVCMGSTGEVYATTAGMSGYTWLVSGGGIITSGSGTNSITVNWNTVGAQSVSVSYTDANFCQTLVPTIFPVSVLSHPTPIISGQTSVCLNSTGNTYSGQAGMAAYNWSVSSGGTVTAGGGSGDNSVTVTWNSTAPQTVSLNCTDTHGCTGIAAFVMPITVNSLPVPVIIGAPGMCLNTSGVYTTAAGMTGYVWTVSAGGTVISGAGTNAVTILWTVTGNQTVSVNYTDFNGCAAASPSQINIIVSTLPIPVIKGPVSICDGSSATYSTQNGMNNYSWTVSSGGTVLSGGGPNDSTIIILWSSTGAQIITVNYFAGIGCTAAHPDTLYLNVKPVPAVTNASNSTICTGTATNITLLPSLPGTTFTWTASGSSPNVGGYSSSGGTVISQILTNSGVLQETVDYTVTPHLNGCDGQVAHFIVTVNPSADVYFNPTSQTMCTGGVTNIQLLSHVTGAVFSYTATGNPALTGYGPGSVSPISQVLTNSGTAPGVVTYFVTPAFLGCTGILNTVNVTVNPFPVVLYTPCTDVVTTTAAQPIQLRGGLPPGGTYSGTGVNAGYFSPSVAGPGNHIVNYSFSNTWGCTAAASQNITVVNAVPFFCGNQLTDVRDNKQYPTIKIGTQCWMAAGLNFGTTIAGSTAQRDNCIPEKYCYADNVTKCASFGGLYQWDEMMQYSNNPASQGFCPPGWHVPAENDWNALFSNYVSIGLAAIQLKTTGFSGFNAYLSGSVFSNIIWYFNDYSVMLWSSTSDGPSKAWAHGMNSPDPSVSTYPSIRSHAFSVRCIKD